MSFFKKEITSTLPNLRDVPVVGSKKVMLRVEETYEIYVPITSSLKDFEDAKRHLHIFAEEIGYTDAKIQERRGDDEIILWFSGPSSVTAHDYNKSVYRNIVWVEDLIETKTGKIKKL